MRVLPHCGNSRSRRSMTGAAAGKQNQRLRFLPFCIGQVAVAKRRAALLAGLRLARRRLPSEQFRSASMNCRPRCGRLSVRQHGSVSCWWSLPGGRPHVLALALLGRVAPQAQPAHNGRQQQSLANQRDGDHARQHGTSLRILAARLYSLLSQDTPANRSA